MPSPSPEPSTPAGTSSLQAFPTEPIGISPQLAPDTLTLPTVLITYKHPLSNQPRSVKARIDRNVPLEEVIRQLAASAQLAVHDSPQHFALRDAANNELITNENVYRKVSGGSVAFKLVPSPALEARDMADRLSNNASDEKMIKLLLFSLKDYLREPDFTNEFEVSGGTSALIKLCETASAGNTLAYALSALQVLAEQDRANGLLNQTGLRRFSRLLKTSALINVLRPTTAILRRLICTENGFEYVWASLESLNHDHLDKKSLDHQGGVEDCGEHILSVLARRVSSGASADFSLSQVSLGLVNDIIKSSLISPTIKTDRDLFISFEESLERSNMSKSVIRLKENGTIELDGLVLSFQNLLGQLFRKLKEMDVSSEFGRDVGRLMEMADRASALDRKPNETVEQMDEREARKWKTLGFESENLLDDFEGVGSLGLKLMYRFTTLHTPEFDKFIVEELARPESKRCPFAKASNKAAEILAEIYEWDTSETSQSPRLLNVTTAYQPLMLQLPKLHSHVLRFFRLMWQASGATTHDFTRVGVLVRSHVLNTLIGVCKFDSSKKQWSELVRELETVDYVRVRDRQMQELALEDSLLNKPPVRSLRGKVYQDSLEFIKNQRINCLMQGSWFPHYQTSNSPPISASLIPGTGGSLRTKNSMVNTPAGIQQQHQQRWRFYRLAPNKKYLHYLESNAPGPIRNGVDEMPDRIEISLITEIISGNGSPEVPTTSTTTTALINSSNNNGGLSRGRDLRRVSTHSNTSNTTAGSSTPPIHHQHHQQQQQTPINNLLTGVPPRLSLMGAGQTLAILSPASIESHSEWLDGLNLLRHDDQDVSVVVQTKESMDILFSLTQIGTLVKLLDLSGERVEIPNSVEVPPVPISTEFFYAEETAPNDDSMMGDGIAA